MQAIAVRSISMDEHAERDGSRLIVALPYVLLGLSFTASAGAGLLGASVEQVVALIAATAVLVAFRVWWQRATAPDAVRLALYAVNLLVLLIAVALSPFYAIAAFIGYLDAAEMHSTRRVVPILVATGLITALGQSGGFAALAGWPLLYVVMVLVNVGIGGTMLGFERRRQATMRELAATVAELRASEARNAQLREQVIEQARVAGVLDERQRLSREIHDTVAQGLVAVITQLEGAEAAARHERGDDARVRIARAQASARDSLGEVRRSVDALASPRLDNVDLSAALERLTTGWAEQHGIDATVTGDGDVVRGPHDADLLRVAQESLANIARHSGRVAWWSP